MCCDIENKGTQIMERFLHACMPLSLVLFFQTIWLWYYTPNWLHTSACTYSTYIHRGGIRTYVTEGRERMYGHVYLQPDLLPRSVENRQKSVDLFVYLVYCTAAGEFSVSQHLRTYTETRLVPLN